MLPIFVLSACVVCLVVLVVVLLCQIRLLGVLNFEVVLLVGQALLSFSM
jgi:hypothetical protein